MSTLTYEELLKSKARLPENLRRLNGAVRIQALLDFTRRQKGIPIELPIDKNDLEPLLVSGFIELKHLTEKPPGSGKFRVTVLDGKVKA